MSAQQMFHQFIHGQPTIGLPFEKELVVDLFAGGGGASTGIARAYTVVGPRHKEMAEWVVRYWDYFNLSTQRAVTLQFKVVKEVDETLTICGFGPPPIP